MNTGRPKSSYHSSDRAVAVILAILLFPVGVYVAYLESLVSYWDDKIERLCASDGGANVGLRVYERVMAPEHYVRPAAGAMPADVKVPWLYEGKRPRADEPIVEQYIEVENLRPADPRVSRVSLRIVRLSDSKVLAEELAYVRSGGGVSGPDPEGTHRCPLPENSDAKTRGIYSAVFLNHPAHRQ